MSKTIKIIDLLNKIAKNDNYHPTIKYAGITYTYIDCDYKNDKDDRYGILSGWCINLILNNEVEIIEEQEEIDIQGIKELDEYEDIINYDDTEIAQNRMIINELVQAVKQLDKNIKEKAKQENK